MICYLEPWNIGLPAHNRPLSAPGGNLFATNAIWSHILTKQNDFSFSIKIKILYTFDPRNTKFTIKHDLRVLYYGLKVCF